MDQRIEELKKKYMQLYDLFDVEKFDDAFKFIDEQIKEFPEDVSLHRMLLDVTKPWSDIESVQKVRTSLIALIESKIGKIH